MSTQIQPSEWSTTDPAHPSNPNSDHTTTSGGKPTNVFTAITDPDFLPTLDSAPPSQRFKSHALLLSLIVGGVLGAWLFGFELFQFEQTPNAQIPFQPPEPTAQSWKDVGGLLALVVLVLGVLVSWTGALKIDWWELTLGYWWLSMPVAGAAGVLLVMAQESGSGMDEID